MGEVYYRSGMNPGRLIAAVFFALFVTTVMVSVMWFVYTAPVKVEEHARDGQVYHCSYYRDGDIKCRNVADSDVGGGRVIP